jgi:esterase
VSDVARYGRAKGAQADVNLFHTAVTLTGPGSAGTARPTRWVLFLHGILGSGGNWRTLAKRVLAGFEARDAAAGNPQTWGAILVDLRMHGRSQHFAAPHTVAAAAADLAQLAAAYPEPIEAVVAHSFGGKVALAYTSARDGDLADVFIVDSTPSARDTTSPRGSEGTLGVLQTLERLPASFPSRRAFEEALADGGLPGASNQGLRTWLATNVEATEDGRSYRLRLELPAIRALLEDYFTVDAWPTVESPPGRVRLHVLVADRSNVLDESDRARARRAAEANPGRVFYEVIPDAGHWVHVDAPDALIAEIVRAR